MLLFTYITDIHVGRYCF